MGLKPFGKSPKEDGERLTRPFKDIDGWPCQNVCIPFVKSVKSRGTSVQLVSLALTASLTFLPSTVLPARPAITETGASSAKDMGKVMKAVMAGLAGKTVDGKKVSESVKARLS